MIPSLQVTEFPPAEAHDESLFFEDVTELLSTIESKLVSLATQYSSWANILSQVRYIEACEETMEGLILVLVVHWSVVQPHTTTPPGNDDQKMRDAGRAHSTLDTMSGSDGFD